MKKIIALVLAALMLVACFAGCRSVSSGNNLSATDIAVKEPVTFPLEETAEIVVYSQLANFNGELTGWFAEILKEKFNVKLTIIPDADGVYATRMESGDLGDIVIWGNNGADYLAAAQGGYLYDWEDGDLVGQYGPVIKESMPKALEANRELNGNGCVYGFGHNVAYSSNDCEDVLYTWDLRFDLYQQIGSPEIKNLDDLYNAFVEMKKICPKGEDGNETYAYSIWPDWDGNMVMYVKSAATAYYGYDEFGFGLYNPDNGEYYAALDPNGPYIEMLRWFNKLHRAGLIDRDSPTQTFDKMSEKLENGRVFASIFNYAGHMTYNTEEHLAAGKGMFSVLPTEAKPIVYGMSMTGQNRIWSIGAQTEHPEVCMAIINWLCTPEGRLTSDYGPKGICWDYDENGKTYFTELGKRCKADKNIDMAVETGGKYTGKFGDSSNQMNNTTWTTSATNPESGEPFNCDKWASNQVAAQYEIDQQWRDWASAEVGKTVNINYEYLNELPSMVSVASTYAEAKMDDELKFKADSIKTLVVNGSWQCITAEDDAAFDKILQDTIDECNALGYDEVTKFYVDEAARKFELQQASKN